MNCIFLKVEVMSVIGRVRDSVGEVREALHTIRQQDHSLYKLDSHHSTHYCQTATFYGKTTLLLLDHKTTHPTNLKIRVT